jgi:hypothetical protein
MRTPSSNRQVATSSIPSSHQRRLRLTFVQAVLGLVALVFSLPLYAQSEPAPAMTIIVLVYNYVGVPHSTLVGAERVANRVLATARTQADFVECLEQSVAPASKDLCQRGWTTQTPGLRFISGSNKFQEAEFAETAIPVLSTIYYEKVARRAHRENADADLPVFLGCVIAHELGHLLLGHPGHSATGIMQPQWGRTQLRQAQTGNLVFTREQATHIKAQAGLLASLRIAESAFPPPKR